MAVGHAEWAGALRRLSGRIDQYESAACAQNKLVNLPELPLIQLGRMRQHQDIKIFGQRDEFALNCDDVEGFPHFAANGVARFIG